jgi:hypothetical protein
MTHTITSTTTQGYVDQAQWGDVIVTSKKRSAARKLARLMLDGGATEGPIEARSADGRLLWTHRSLTEFAGFDISEEPRLHTAKWAPNPLFAKAA